MVAFEICHRAETLKRDMPVTFSHTVIG
jgi:hypothetical protein